MGISQEEIVHNAQTVTKGLEALRLEHQSLLGGLQTDNFEDEALMLAQREKCSLLERSLESIDLGLGEAHVMAALAGHLQAVEAEKQKLRSQVNATINYKYIKSRVFNIIDFKMTDVTSLLHLGSLHTTCGSSGFHIFASFFIAYLSCKMMQKCETIKNLFFSNQGK